MPKKDLAAAISTGADRFFTAAQEEKETRSTNEVQEALLVSDERKTQGRKGMKLRRMNISLTQNEYEHVRLMASITGQSMTNYLSTLIQKDAASKKDLMEKAKALLLEGGELL